MRKISVSELVKTPAGELDDVTLRHGVYSFIGEVEALNTTTIRRLTCQPVTNFWP